MSSGELIVSEELEPLDDETDDDVIKDNDLDPEAGHLFGNLDKGVYERVRLHIQVMHEPWAEVFEDLPLRCQKIINAVAHFVGIEFEEAEVSIVFCDDAFIQELNKRYRQKDKPTNVLSFPTDKDVDAVGVVQLGDMILAWETICAEVKEQNKTLESHMSHLLIHGFLHLLGFDHEQEDEAEEMEKIEIAIMQELGYEDPYTELPMQVM